VIVAACLLGGSGGAGAAAPARLCRDLQAQLSSAGNSRAPAMVRKYDRAIEAQEEELQRARRVARASRCTGLFSAFGGDRDGRCGVVNDTIDRMERNLAMLERRRGKFAAGGERTRQQILAAIDANGCNDRQADERRLPPPVDPDAGRNAFLERVNRGVIIHRSGPPQEGDVPATTFDGGDVDPSGTYRTMCVRTCDGYYFPISFATSPANFGRDAQTCQAQCPGTRVELYYHIPDQESEEMVSLAGVPYKELPTAFLYRKANAPRLPGCTCAAGRDSSIIAATPPGEDDSSSRTGTAAPVAVPRPSNKPAGSEKSSPVGNSRAEASTSEPAPAADKDRKVRVVGPTFLPDPSKAIDLRAPAPKDAR
jgi:hypothetical protein